MGMHCAPKSLHLAMLKRKVRPFNRFLAMLGLFSPKVSAIEYSMTRRCPPRSLWRAARHLVLGLELHPSSAVALLAVAPESRRLFLA
jgi:hypothetical protein